ncbi:MAG: hypothetical protein Q9M94_03210 [Candidatus Gracilibacteria bacterium]|nr:hypothetical protein [Candidatus Gracilibacteria bacterium]MDQ7022369.1 hypothetical protein [Candidatus Gracilibacteria bacterium]
MGKIIKKSVEKITVNKEKFNLNMKGEFKIEFASDSFGPYKYKFERVDCYFNDGLEDRGTAIFPLQNKKFNNTEIFLETDDIVIAVGERGGLIGEEKSFIDIINIKTEKKYRLFTEEVNLVYNDKDKIVINAKESESNEFKTFILDLNTLKKIEEKKEELNAFFKSVYNKNEKKWYLLDFTILDKSEKDEEKKYQFGYFNLKSTQLTGKPESFDRKSFVVKTNSGKIDIWEESKK